VIIDTWRLAHARKQRVIVESDNLLQSLFIFQYRRSYYLDYSLSLGTEWTVCTSPIELPISDVGIVPMNLATRDAIHYVLPISPILVLQGLLFKDPARRPPQQAVRGLTLSLNEAEYLLDCICASAISEIICSRQLPNIPASINRAKANGTTFRKIVRPDAITSAGMKSTNEEFRYRVVSLELYKQVVHSHITP